MRLFDCEVVFLQDFLTMFLSSSEVLLANLAMSDCKIIFLSGCLNVRLLDCVVVFHQDFLAMFLTSSEFLFL